MIIRNLQPLVLIQIILIFSFALVGQNITYSPGDTLYAYAFDGLKLRALPNITSEKIGLIEFGQTVEVISNNEKGNWINIRYHDLTGYAFGDYLSKLPNSKLNQENLRFKFFDQNKEEDPYEGHQMEVELVNYIENNFVKACETAVFFEPRKGQGGQTTEITKLQNGYTKINTYGWEGHTLELVLPNSKISEIKNLILYIARKAIVYQGTFKNIEDSLQNINDYSDYQEILNLSMFWIRIKKYPEINTWSIEFSIAVS